ncbi:MAG: hypothetical protein ACI4RH_11600 [Huintestinicola sp.]
MKKFDELILVNYCYPDCIPLMNIMRLAKDDAFELAQKLAVSHPETTAFYRFADFENYYTLRQKQDEYLYSQFCELGGMPEEKNPISFVIEGSDYLREWFSNGLEARLLLKNIPPQHISFTIGDRGAEFQQNKSVELLTADELKARIDRHCGDFDIFLKATGKHYIEAQLWSDRYISNIF